MGLAGVKKTTQGVELESFDGLLRGMNCKKKSVAPLKLHFVLISESLYSSGL
jgi:hypothetical protein